LEECISGKQSSRRAKSSGMQKRGEANLGQKEARLEKKKAAELTAKNHANRRKNKGTRLNRLLHRARREIEA
jgi:hypothetical protein